jgi:hypothetical protein
VSSALSDTILSGEALADSDARAEAGRSPM